MNKGLNFLTAAENKDTKREDSNVKNESEIIIERKKIFRNDIKGVKVLTLVFVQTLYLHIENRVGV